MPFYCSGAAVSTAPLSPEGGATRVFALFPKRLGDFLLGKFLRSGSTF